VHFELICRPDSDLALKARENAGYDFAHVSAALQARQARWDDTYAVVDTTGRSDEERWTLYNELACPTAQRHGYRVGQVFGTNRDPGKYFGAEVPALVAYDREGDTATYVWPHEPKIGPLVTIADALGLT
jgi:hypothetical protein